MIVAFQISTIISEPAPLPYIAGMHAQYMYIYTFLTYSNRSTQPAFMEETVHPTPTRKSASNIAAFPKTRWKHEVKVRHQMHVVYVVGWLVVLSLTAL